MYKASLIVALFVTFPPLSLGDGQSSCGTSGNACQNTQAPIAASMNMPLQIDEPEASALAPIPAGPSKPVDGAPDGRMMAGRSHDNELFSDPEKKNAIIDPFGKEAGTPLNVAPPRHP